ncbi:MAG TPA: pyrroline-5-carboxylate reductase, partial [Opitutales bacterium]|nr:pyrroline-5-carboxylate reductase [Opitutales bacterium]
FIGAGAMAKAMIQGVLQSQAYAPTQIACCSATGRTSQALSKQTGIACLANAADIVASCDTVVIACKPLELEHIGPVATAPHKPLIMSVLARRSLQDLRKHFPDARVVVRCMPNTPVRIGFGMIPYSVETPLNPPDLETLHSILKALGSCLEMPESDLPAATALSGCGPAYYFKFTEALCQAAIAQGLSPSIAAHLAKQTALGAAQLMQTSQESIPELIKEVAHPGGITESALAYLDKQHFDTIIKEMIATTAHHAQSF